MNFAETHDLLTLAATLDRRRFDDATVVAWQEILADQPFEDCRTAVIRHFASATDYLMPAHVLRGANEIDRERRRLQREARERQAQLALEADPTRRDRSDETRALIAELRDSLPEGDRDKLRRTEWLDADRRRARMVDAEPNPHFDPAVLAAALTTEER